MESVSVGLWSILPPLVAIVLALLTKEVIFSLACGIFSGAVIYAVAANLGVAGVFSSVSDLMIEKMGGNAALLLFVVLLGALVADYQSRRFRSIRQLGCRQTAFWHQRAACHRFFGLPDFY